MTTNTRARRTGQALVALTTAPLVGPLAARAHDPIPPADEIVVHGRGLTQIGRAGAASEGLVGYADLEDRPFARVGELVETIPASSRPSTRERARRTSTSCAASTSITAPTSRRAWTGCR